VWISLIVPVAVLLAPLLLQRLEAKLLDTPEPTERPDSLPLLTRGPLERSTQEQPTAHRPPQRRSTLRATA
jgi:hypothetical protein